MEAIPIPEPDEESIDLRWVDRDALYDRLPARELRILQLVADGLSDDEVASRIRESEYRVASVVQGLLTELGFQSRAQVILYVITRDVQGPTPPEEDPGPLEDVTGDPVFHRLTEEPG
jgi:DNA-binding NarL/FixJ family response regulator